MNCADTVASSIPMKPPRLSCPGIASRPGRGGIVLTRRWLRSKHYLMLVAVAAGWMWLGSHWAQQSQRDGLLIFLSIIWLSWTYNLLAMFVNETKITATHERVDVTHGPLPSPLGIRRSAESREIQHLSIVRIGSRFAIQARLIGGDARTLVSPLMTAEQASFVAAQLRHQLGQGQPKDEPRDLDEGGRIAHGLLAVLIPVIIGGSLLLFSRIASSKVDGQLDSSGGLGKFSFVPDACTSGQHAGFGGVTLISQQSATVIRVVNDPVKGQLLVVVRPGEKNHVIDGHECSTFHLKAERTSTSVNEIWLVDGSLEVSCPDLTGRATFEGCR